jgi:hypothetical protein
MTSAFPEHRYELDETVRLGFQGSEQTIQIDILHMDVTHQVVLFGTCSVEMLEVAFQNKAFHLDGETNLPGWNPDREIEIWLKLDPTVAASFATTDDIFVSLFQEDSPLRHADSWYALEAMQHEKVPWDPDAETSFGIRTRWADMPPSK